MVAGRAVAEPERAGGGGGDGAAECRPGSGRWRDREELAVSPGFDVEAVERKPGPDASHEVGGLILKHVHEPF